MLPDLIRYVLDPQNIASRLTEEIRYQACENTSRALFEYIRNNLFSNPRVISMVDITSKLLSTMSSAGINEVSDSTKKNLRRKLEMEFGDSPTFFTESHCVYIMPDNLKKKVLAAECIQLSSMLESFEKGNKDNTIVQTSMSLREQIKSIPFKDHRPPKPGELTPDYVHIPPSLQKFLHV